MANPALHTTNTFAARQHREGLQQDAAGPEQVTIGGVQYQQVTYTDRAAPLSGVTGWANRIGRGALGVVGTVATLGFANASSDFRDATWRTAATGRVENEVVYGGVDPLDAERVPSDPRDPDSPTRLQQRLGYDPKNRESIGRFMQQAYLDGRCIQSNGNLMFIEERRDGTSAMLFVPGMDYTKACSIKMSNASTGAALKGNELERAMNTYSTQYQDMLEGMDKKSDELAVQLGKKRGLSDDEIEAQKDELKAEVRRNYRSAVLDFKHKNVRLFGKVDPNQRGMYSRKLGGAITSGTRIDWSKGTSKDVDEIHKAAKKGELPTPVTWPAERRAAAEPAHMEEID